MVEHRAWSSAGDREVLLPLPMYTGRVTCLVKDKRKRQWSRKDAAISVVDLISYSLETSPVLSYRWHVHNSDGEDDGEERSVASSPEEAPEAHKSTFTV